MKKGRKNQKPKGGRPTPPPKPPVSVKLFFRQSDLMPSRIRGEYPGVAFEHRPR